MIFDMNSQESSEKYRLLTSCIVPRPIAWVSSISKDNIPNIAPFSYFTGVSIEPPLVLFAVERRKNAKKDTLKNIEETKAFVIHLVTETNVSKMNMTSQDYKPDVNEIEMAGLTMIPSITVNVPSIKESPIRLECKLHEVFEIGYSPHSLIIGEVKTIVVDDEMIENGRIQMDRVQAVGRMGGKWYSKTGELFELPRLDWRKSEM